MKRFLILILSVIALASCSTVQHVNYSRNYVRSCEGRTRADLLRTFGPPSFVVNNGDGWKTYVYIGNKRIFAYTNDYERSVTDLPTAEFVFDQYGVCQKADVYNTGSANVVSVGATLALMGAFLILIL